MMAWGECKGKQDDVKVRISNRDPAWERSTHILRKCINRLVLELGSV